MTIEKKVWISPNDIVSVGWECPHCTMLYSVPVGKLDRSLPEMCPNCQERLASGTQLSSSELADSTVLLAFLVHLRNVQDRPFGKSLRFGLSGDPRTDGKLS